MHRTRGRTLTSPPRRRLALMNLLRQQRRCSRASSVRARVATRAARFPTKTHTRDWHLLGSQYPKPPRGPPAAQTWNSSVLSSTIETSTTQSMAYANRRDTPAGRHETTLAYGIDWKLSRTT